ncbi:hypothetical protein R0137_03250 [Congregibacter brevis]|uniref:Uncharacterized protein n=1 Tax=Congregibacter brevis TaxID=3081201 RepID=A0ABZ0IEV1_9GAMM|nr:hypothetical protein R0137_03250 [Congregibacter sp. IMCC45268]
MKEQNWFAVLLDFSIVVIGVFIGLQVANLNDERVNDGLRAEYLTGLIADLKADIEEAKRVESIAWERFGAIEDIFEVAALETPLHEYFVFGEVNKAPPVPDVSYEYPFAHNHVLSYVDLFGATQDTFAALVSNGHFQLLDEPELIRSFQSYNRLVSEVQAFDEAITLVFRRVSDFRSRHGISLGGRTTLEDLATAVEADPQLAAELDSYFMNSGVQAARMLEIRAAAKALIHSVETAQQRR